MKLLLLIVLIINEIQGKFHNANLKPQKRLKKRS